MNKEVLNLLKEKGPQDLLQMWKHLCPDHPFPTIESLIDSPTELQKTLTNLLENKEIDFIYQVKDKGYHSFDEIPKKDETANFIGLNDINVIFSLLKESQ